MFIKHQKKTATDNSSSATPKTAPSNSASRTRIDELAYFKKKWGVDKDGFATLKNGGDPSMCQAELQDLIDEINQGFTVETYHDRSGHKRYRLHPSRRVLGVKYRDERFGFGNVKMDDTKKTLSICHVFDGDVEDEWLEDIDMLDYTRFYGFLPVIDTRSLSFDIWRVLNHEMKICE